MVLTIRLVLYRFARLGPNRQPPCVNFSHEFMPTYNGTRNREDDTYATVDVNENVALDQTGFQPLQA